MRSCLLFCALMLLTTLAAAMDSSGAAAKAQQATGGRVLGVERVEQGGAVVFKVKVLTPNGDVRIVVVDAKTGAVR